MSVYYESDAAWVPLEITKTGKTALWESGGGKSRTGESVLIADKVGNPKVPIFIKTKGPLSCGDHALFIVEKGDIVVHTRRKGATTNTDYYRIVAFDTERKRAYLAKIGHKDLQYFWEQYGGFVELLDRGVYKAEFYHCRFPVYYRETRVKKDEKKGLTSAEVGVQ